LSPFKICFPSFKATFSLQKGWSYKKVTTVNGQVLMWDAVKLKFKLVIYCILSKHWSYSFWTHGHETFEYKFVLYSYSRIVQSEQSNYLIHCSFLASMNTNLCSKDFWRLQKSLKLGLWFLSIHDRMYLIQC
jgi:hypothetical protein